MKYRVAQERLGSTVAHAVVPSSPWLLPDRYDANTSRVPPNVMLTYCLESAQMAGTDDVNAFRADYTDGPVTCIRCIVALVRAAKLV